MKRIEIKAPAKINIGLNIVSKRTDGFHNLETLFYPLKNLYDTIVLEKSNLFGFKTSSEILSSENNNLILKAVKLIQNFTDEKITLSIFLDKRIPIGAGLGGGSSDAAAALLAINELYKINLPQNKLSELALQLGSDVPFFLISRPAIGEARGERLTEIDFNVKGDILVINPNIHISTKDAFRSIIPGPNKFDYFNLEGYEGNLSDFQSLIKNDFENSIFEQFEEIKNIKNEMLDSGASFSLMSGTGSTVYGIFNSRTEMNNCAAKFPVQYKIIKLPRE